MGKLWPLFLMLQSQVGVNYLPVWHLLYHSRSITLRTSDQLCCLPSQRTMLDHQLSPDLPVCCGSQQQEALSEHAGKSRRKEKIRFLLCTDVVPPSCFWFPQSQCMYPL